MFLMSKCRGHCDVGLCTCWIQVICPVCNLPWQIVALQFVQCRCGVACIRTVVQVYHEQRHRWQSGRLWICQTQNHRWKQCRFLLARRMPLPPSWASAQHGGHAYVSQVCMQNQVSSSVHYMNACTLFLQAIHALNTDSRTLTSDVSTYLRKAIFAAVSLEGRVANMLP